MIEDALHCIRPHECRSPYACASIFRCADTLTPGEDSRAFGFGYNGGRYGAKGIPRPWWTVPHCKTRPDPPK